MTSLAANNNLTEYLFKNAVDLQNNWQSETGVNINVFSSKIRVTDCYNHSFLLNVMAYHGSCR
jgi:hypothetical protein